MKIMNNRGFALTSAVLAWLAGLTALLGGGAYTATKLMDDKDDYEYYSYAKEEVDHSFIPTYDEIKNTPMGNLSESERIGLINMREEEKLARDVYRTMYEMWGVKIFDNTSYSEERHMQAVKTLLDKYDIDDPVIEDRTGVFTIPAMQTLYDDLVAQGKISMVDALKVGATIEDLDIYDLEQLIMNTDNEDIKLVYENLQRASRNHLRSFYKQLTQNDSDYTPQYLSQTEMDQIINSPKEQGDGHGDRRREGRGKRHGQERDVKNFERNSWFLGGVEEDLEDLDNLGGYEDLEYGLGDESWDDYDDDSYHERGQRDFYREEMEHREKVRWR